MPEPMMPEQIATLLNLYTVFNISLLALSAYIFFKLSPDIMKALEYRCFKAFIVIFQLYLLFETVQTLSYFGIIRLPYNVHAAICFASLLCAVGNAFLFYMTLYLNIDLSFAKRARSIVLSCIPLLATVFLLTISLFTGSIFKIENGVMEKGKYYPLLLLLSAIYLLLAARISIKKAKTLKTSKAKREALGTALLVVFLIIWVIIDNGFEGTTVLPIAIFAVIFHMFITYQQSGIYTDMLTGMNNRRRAEMYLGNEISNGSSDDMPLYIFMGDINGFKEINDEYGHHEGDCALIIFAEAVKKSADAYHGFTARYGGDEFVWAWRPVKGGDFDPGMVIEDIRHRVAAECVAEHKPYVISLSIGYVVCEDTNRPITAYLKEADRKMYADKQGYYRNKKS